MLTLAGIVVIGYMRVCEKSEQIVFYFEDAFPETLKFLAEVRQAFTQEFLHFGLQRLYLPFRDIARPPEVDGMW